MPCKNAAWCRVDSNVSDFESLAHRGDATRGKFATSPEPADEYHCGRSIEKLAELVASDLRAARTVALGFEAPMWLPLEHEHQPRLNLFGPRFPAEKGFEWYLQSGAAASLKAIALGVMLREHLKRSLSQCQAAATTLDGRTAGRLVLFEAFVAGTYQVSRFTSTTAPNEWDAFVAALAWGAIHAGLSVPPGFRAVPLHTGGTRKGPCLSIWSVIFSDEPVAGPPDCDVVALERVPTFGEAG
jgi:hypothetical protein